MRRAAAAAAEALSETLALSPSIPLPPLSAARAARFLNSPVPPLRARDAAAPRKGRERREQNFGAPAEAEQGLAESALPFSLALFFFSFFSLRIFDLAIGPPLST